MRTPAAKLGALVVTCALLLAGCGGTGSSTGSTSANPRGTGNGTAGPAAPGSSGGPGSLGGGSSGGAGDPTPFLVTGAVMSYAFHGVDVLVAFNQCQRAGLQHAADTLDQHFDPNKICRQPAGTACHGVGRYAGLTAGAPVRITDASGAVVATGLLRQGHLSGPLTLEGPKAACAFGFEVPEVPGGRARYAVSIDGTSRFAFTQAGAGNVLVPIHD